MKKSKIILFSVTLILIFLVGCNIKPAGIDFASIPAGKGYAEGEVIYFSHTETSDEELSINLTKMMNSPVLFVPQLGNVPEGSTSNVYVFENGLIGSGPLGYQPDVFDSPPGFDGYSPLRKVILVKWVVENNIVEFMSVKDIDSAVDKGVVTLTPTDIVVNMPFMTWSDGKR